MELGVEFAAEADLNQAFQRFKELADKKHEIFDEDLQALITEASMESEDEKVKLVALKVCSETGEIPQLPSPLKSTASKRRASPREAGRWMPASRPSNRC